MIQACAITGVRPTRFKFGYKEDYSLCKKIKRALENEFRQLHDEESVQCFYIGGSLGVDIWAGEIVLRLKEQSGYEDVQLILALPFPDYQQRWDSRSQKRLNFLIRHSKNTFFVGEEDCRESYVDRNCYMVDHAKYLVTVSESELENPKDILQIVRYAKKKKRKVVYIHPDTAAVTEPEK